MDVAQALQQARARNIEQKAAAVAALGAAARTGQPAQQDALRSVEAPDRALLHRLAHDVSKRDLWDNAAAALAFAICGALVPTAVVSERDAACQLLRKHSYALGFQDRSTAELAPAVPLLLDVLVSPASSPLGQREAAGSLMNLAWKSTDHADAMVAGGAFGVLVSVLNSDEAASDAGLLDNAAGAVLNILSHGSVTAAYKAAAGGVLDVVTERLLSAGKNKWSRVGAKIVECVARPAAQAVSRGRPVGATQKSHAGATTDSSVDSVNSDHTADAAVMTTIAAAFASNGGAAVRSLAQLCACAATARDTRCCALRALGCAAAAEAAAPADTTSSDIVARLEASDTPLLQTLLEVLAPCNSKPIADVRLAGTQCLAGIACNPAAARWLRMDSPNGTAVQVLSAQLDMDVTLGIGVLPTLIVVALCARSTTSRDN